MNRQKDKVTHPAKHKTILLKFSLYLVSLWTLLLMLIILKVDCSGVTGDMNWKQWTGTLLGNNIFSIICLIVFLVGSVGYFFFRDISTDAKSLTTKVEKCKSINYENLSFLATYIIPLICFPIEDTREVIVLFLTILLIGIIFVKTDLFYTNPSLALLGFNIYRIQLADPEECVLICKGKLQKGDSIKYMRLSENVLFGRRA